MTEASTHQLDLLKKPPAPSNVYKLADYKKRVTFLDDPVHRKILDNILKRAERLGR